jgi:peptidoglycan/LPS O-acetylase OafA/YrhL
MDVQRAPQREVIATLRISFPLYLVHVTPLLWLGYRLQSAQADPALSIAAIVLYVVLSIGLTALLHVSIERPSQSCATAP